MAQQNLSEDESTDFSGLASSLLPPSGTFFSGWTPPQWQNITQSHNAHDLQSVQPPLTNSYHSASFQNGLQDSSAAYQPYDPNDYGGLDRALSSREASASASAAPSDSAQVQFYQNMNNSGYGANLAASYGLDQSRPASAAYLDNNARSSRNALNGTATPPGSLAELKLKAKESIMAKKAQNVRSSSQETATQTNGMDPKIATKNESLTRNDTSKTKMETTESYSLRLREELGGTTKSNLNLPTTQEPQSSIRDAFKVTTPHSTVNRNLIPARDDNPAGVKASSVELEALLAEGRAAAEKRSHVAPESTGFRSGPDPRTCGSETDGRMQLDQIGTGAKTARSADCRTSTYDLPQQRDTPGGEYNKRDRGNDTLAEETLTRQVQEQIPRDISTALENANGCKLQADRDTDTSDAPKPEDIGHQIYQSQSHKPLGSQEQMAAHETTGAGGQYSVNDVEEWLVMTGFYDELYRQKVLNRRRRMKAIEEERLHLLLEEHADQEQRSQLVRSRSVLAANPAPVSPFLARASSLLPVPAPPTRSSTTQDLGLRIKDSALKIEKSLLAVKSTETAGRAGSLKRRNSPPNVKDEEGHARKIVRTDSNDHEAAPPRRAIDKTSAGSPLIRQQSPQARTERFVEEQHPSDPRREGDLSANQSLKRRYDQWVPDRPAVYDEPRRNLHDSRNVRGFDTERRTNRPSFNSGHRHSDYQSSDHRSARYGDQGRSRRNSLDETSPTKSGVNLRVNNVRYFLIKSWNYENIETARRECTWCTQTKNEDLFVDAFRSSTHVILIFSANNSHAFQGYARMQCLPGEPGVTDPTWRKYLHWPTTQPFKIRWITKGDSAYRVAGNLRNPLNDDSLVFVGRDGQEIPDHIGLELCEALDQDAKYRGKQMDY